MAESWTIEVWVPPVRDNGRIVKKGRWKNTGSVASDSEAKEAVLRIASEKGVSRAYTEGSEMRAYKRRGFHWWRSLHER